MADEIINFTIPLDDDGFVTLQCPFCRQKFKATGSDVNDENNFELFCPYCGLVTEPNEFFTDEVKEKALRIAENYFSDKLNGFASDLERSFRGGSFLEFQKGKDFEINNPKIIIESDDMNTYTLPCCGRKIKAQLIDDELYCPFCGGDVHGDNNR
ncbi:hypothetical protein [Clostridium saccharobutylicum]|uniref:TFIIB zinc-binding protein n=1 Tax=Clostridium saccharobutylicum TaxID=169679 RepID=A0A1S8MZ27_CLOSA|nr:hypothetical protein [Clostridium saccharobutylicum]OOM09429.1 hypothetical protein CLOSAC_37100 [Clostridium saccharobutylicum]